MSGNIEFRGLDDFLRKLDRLDPAEAERILRPAMQEAIDLLQEELADYPTKSAGAFSRTATPGQKRAFWAKVKSGEAGFRPGIGYVRTGTLGRRWTNRIRRISGGLEGVVGNVTPYAPFVQGKPGQQPFHALSGWRRIDKVILVNRDKIVRIFERAIGRAMR